MKVAIYNYGEIEKHTGLHTSFKNFYNNCISLGFKTTIFTYQSEKFTKFKKGISKPRQIHKNGYSEFLVSYNCILKAVERLNTYDIVVVFKLPDSKGDLFDYKGFIEIYESIETKTWLQYHKVENNLRNLSYKNRCLLEIVSLSDVVSSYDTEFSEVAQICRLGKKKIHKLIDFYDFNRFTETLSFPKEKIVAHLGFNESSMKNFLMLADMCLKDNILFKAYGSNKSRIVFKDKNIRARNVINNKVYFNFNLPLFLPQAMFTFVAYELMGETFGNRPFFSQLESTIFGCIPIMHISQGLSCKTMDGKFWYDIPYFAIWFDGNINKLSLKIKEIINNKELQEKYKGVALEVFKKDFGKQNFYSYFKEILDMPFDKGNIRRLLYNASWSPNEIESFHQLSKKNLLKQDFDVLLNKKIKIVNLRETQ